MERGSLSEPTPFDMFSTHPPDIATGDGARVLNRQLSALTHFVDAHRDPAVPCLIMGDIDIPAEDPLHYAEMRERLPRPADLWTVTGGTAARGVTYSPESTFHADGEDIPTHGHRLDYVLLRPGSRLTPIAERCEVLSFTRDGRHVSDHFGVWAEFAWAVESSS